MKALLYEGPQKVAVQEAPVPEVGEGEALIAVESCGLSAADIARITHAKAAAPLPLGHEVAGRVAALGKGTKGFAVGDRVLVAQHVPCGDCHHCRRGSETSCPDSKRTDLDPGGFAELARVSARHVSRAMLKVPKRVDFDAASQAEPLARCLRGAKRLDLQKGDTAAVIGLNATGLMMAQILAARDVTVVAFDPAPARVRIAQKQGIEQAYTGREGNVEEKVRSLSGRRGADAVVLAGGGPALAAETIHWLRDGGTLGVFADFQPEPFLRLDMSALYQRELTVLASRAAGPDDLREALDLIASGEIDVDPYTRDTFPLSRFPEALRQARGKEILKAIIRCQA